jgi:FkbM family methyltransferase
LEAESKKIWGDETISEIILGDGPESEQFYQDEIQNIHQMQSEKPLKDMFYFVKYDQFHVANVEKSDKNVAARRSVELMKQWDFSEPNAMFWFFSDHGDWRTMGEHPQPDHYLSWVMFRDNTADTIEVKSRFIFAGDFFPTIMNKFGYRYESTPRARSIQQPQDTDRIYCTEDGRQRFDKNDSTTAIACRFTGWEKGRPTGLEQVSYFKPRNEFVCLLAHLNADGFVTNPLRIDKIDECLKQALVDRFEWVNESSILSQAGDTQWMKNIRICQDTPDIDNIGFDNCDPQTNGEYALIPYLIRPGDIVFDIGANKGTWSRNVLSIVSPVRIYSFEPVADTFAVLKDNLGDSRASLHNVAISDSDGGKTFFYYNQSSQSAELSSFYRRSFSIEQRLRIKPIPIPVRTRTLDSFCKEHLIPYIDFLKIDTEGAELDVLRGAFELLRERKIKTIQFEYGGTYPDAGITLRQVCQLLSSYGYTIFRILPDGLVHIRRWHDSLENNLYSNYLVVSPERINDYGPMEGFTDSKTEPYYKTKAETVPQTDTLQGQPPRLHLGSGKQGSVMFAAGKNLTDFNSSCSEKALS